MNWLKKEWADVGPHFKYELYKWVVIGCGGTVVTLAVLFMKTIHRIPEPLFYGVLLVITCFCFWFLLRHSRLPGGMRKESSPVLASLPVAQSFQERVFGFCNELSAYLQNRQARPSEEDLLNQTGDSAQLFAQKYNETIQSWDDKVAAGYWLDYRDRAERLRNELVIR